MYYKLCPSQKITPTIRCCEQHLMVGVNFFWTSSPIPDLVHFSQMILPIVLQAICPTIRCCSQHLMVGVIFFFDLFSQSGLRAFFTSDFANCTTDKAPTISCCSQHLMVGFFLTCSQILDLGHFSQIILPIVLQTICLTIRCCSQHLIVGVNFFFDLFSHSGLSVFYTNDFTNCTTGYMSPHQVLFTASDGWG